MPSISNLVQQKTVSAGTGALALTAVHGKQGFYGAFGPGGADVFFYFVSHAAQAEWEVGTGHMSDAATLQRDTVIASSNAGARVNFSAGSKDVVNDIPAQFQLQGPLAKTDVGLGSVDNLQQMPLSYLDTSTSLSANSDAKVASQKAVKAYVDTKRKPYTAATATYSVLTTDEIVEATSSTFTATLPTAVSVTGKSYVLKNSGTGVLTLATTSSQTIDGAATAMLGAKQSLTVVSNGANWIIV